MLSLNLDEVHAKAELGADVPGDVTLAAFPSTIVTASVGDSLVLPILIPVRSIIHWYSFGLHQVS